MMDLIGAVNIRRLPTRTADALFDWTFTHGEGTTIEDADGRALVINDGTISTLSTATAWGTAAMLTTTQGTAKKMAAADVWSTTSCEFEPTLGEAWFLFVRGIWSVPVASTTYGIVGTRNNTTEPGFTLRIGGNTHTENGKGALAIYEGGGSYADTIPLYGAAFPTWVDGAEHSVAVSVDCSTGYSRAYVDGVFKADRTASSLIKKEFRTNYTIDNAVGRLMIGSNRADTSAACGGGQFRRVTSLRRATSPGAAAIDALVARLHQMPNYVIAPADWDVAA